MLSRDLKQTRNSGPDTDNIRLAALSVTLSDAVQVPDAVGLNVTLKVQLAPEPKMRIKRYRPC
jgi:hypothetical protein